MLGPPPDRLAAAGPHQPDPFMHIAQEFQQIRAGKAHAKLMDPTDLPSRQQGLRRIDEGFWRQSTSNYAEPIAGKKRRKQTLGKATRKASRIAKPGRQADCCPLVHSLQLFHDTGAFAAWLVA